MEYLYKISNLQEYAIKTAQEYAEMLIYTAVCFFLPMFLGHNQILVGTAVNALLILAALNVKGYKLLPIILAPSLGAFAGGLIFGPFTIYLLYLIPFIWIGNTILVFSFKYFKLKLNKNYLFTSIIGAFAKSGFLFLSAFLLYSFGIIPGVFLFAMGAMQLITAVSGGIAAYGAQAVKRKYF